MEYVEKDGLIPATEVDIKRRRLVYGVGVNDAWYRVYKYEYINGKKKVEWFCPFHDRWKGMLERCYSKRALEYRPSYRCVTVCEEWKYFSNFKSWMEKQEWEGKQLDKDIIAPDNKVYSPDTCVFVSSKVNKLLTNRAACRGKYKVGVHFNKSKGRFQAQCSDGTGNKKTLGRYDTEQEAYQCYVDYKHALIVKVAHEQEDIRVKEGLLLHAQILLDTLEE